MPRTNNASHKAIRESNSGDLIHLTATDKSTERDIDKFCKFLGPWPYKEKRSAEEVFILLFKKKIRI